jgi:hypothetical protein
MNQIHPQSRSKRAVHAEIARSTDTASIPAKRRDTGLERAQTLGWIDIQRGKII